MINSFKRWEDINENAESTKSKQIYVSKSGHKFKVVIKVQSNNKFMIKAVREMELLDDKSNLTKEGSRSLIQYLNSQQGVINTFGKLDDSFFKNKFIIYTVVKDTDRVEKIQFTISNKGEIEGLDSNIRFISTNALKSFQNKSDVIDGIIRDNENIANTDNIKGEPTQAIDASTDDAEGSITTKDLVGSMFRYTMRTNGVTYLCDIASEGAIDMEPISGNKGPKGAISWESSKVLWYTDWDDAGKTSNVPLYMDSEITNSIDLKFFTSMFTDGTFAKNVIDEYNEKYGSSEITADNLRNMLYYGAGDKKDQRIFTNSNDTKSTANMPSDSGGIRMADTEIIGK